MRCPYVCVCVAACRAEHVMPGAPAVPVLALDVCALCIVQCLQLVSHDHLGRFFEGVSLQRVRDHQIRLMTMVSTQRLSMPACKPCAIQRLAILMQKHWRLRPLAQMLSLAIRSTIQKYKKSTQPF